MFNTFYFPQRPSDDLDNFAYWWQCSVALLWGCIYGVSTEVDSAPAKNAPVQPVECLVALL